MKFAAYSGDVNHEGNIDVSDLIGIYNDQLILASGYLDTDVNGDNFTDVSDLIVAYNNSLNLISAITP